MAKPPSPQLQSFMAKHEIDSDEIWPVRDGAYAIKHFAIERVAARAGIKFERPAFLEHDTASGIVSMVVFGKLGDHEEWSTGEASPKNNKNQYPYAMAEKRAKGRVALKLLTAADTAGAVALYSEEDSDDFKRQNPHVTRAADILPVAEYDENGEVIDNIPSPSPESVKKLRVVDQRPIFEALQKEIHSTGSILELQEWAAANKDRLGSLKSDWQDFLRGVYAEQLTGLRELARGDDNRMAG